MGDVKHIGVRATTIRTFDGSEVMVPNGNMIANDVINWTLSDRKKRRDIFVSVAYGSDPHKVLEVIKKVGEDNPNVLQIPAPWALFEGFGDSSLNFRLRIWTAMDVGLTTKSEVAMSIYDALNEAGIEIPFPQHDLHLKSFDPSIQKIIVPKIGKSKTEK
jgi:small-conductance mechanosensitive channel